MNDDENQNEQSLQITSLAEQQAPTKFDSGARARNVLNVTLELSLILASLSSCALPSSGDLGSFAIGAPASFAIGIASLHAYCRAHARSLGRPMAAFSKAFMASSQRYVAELTCSLASCLLFGYLVGSMPSYAAAVLSFIGILCALRFAWPIPKRAAKACAEELERRSGEK